MYMHLFFIWTSKQSHSRQTRNYLFLFYIWWKWHSKQIMWHALATKPFETASLISRQLSDLFSITHSSFLIVWWEWFLPREADLGLQWKLAFHSSGLSHRTLCILNPEVMPSLLWRCCLHIYGVMSPRLPWIGLGFVCYLRVIIKLCKISLLKVLWMCS